MTPNATDVAADTRTLKVFRVYIKATPERIWEAIVDPEWNAQYGYRAPCHYDLRPGGAYRVVPTDEMRSFGAVDPLIVGEVIEVDPPRKLVQHYTMRFNPELEAEGPTTLTWEIVPEENGLCRVTVTHDVTDAPAHAATVLNDALLHEGGGGWAWILSDLQRMLESPGA